MPAGGNPETPKKQSATMIIQSDRFGSIHVNESDIIAFSSGILGFPGESKFVLVRTENAHAIGWLQSATNSFLALPVVSAHVLAPYYPDVEVESYARRAGLGDSLEELAVMVVLNAPPGIPATINLVAPIIVNVATRRGVQLFLENSRYTNREIFSLPLRQLAASQSECHGAPCSDK